MAPIGSGELFKFYRYDPSIPAAAIFIVLFSTVTALHTYQVYKSRNWICICLAFGGLNETISYILRIFSAKETPIQTIGLFVAQSLPSLLAPALFAAAIYVCLGRIIQSIDGENRSLIRLSWLTKFFVAGDILGLAVQGAGGIIMPQGGRDNYYLGANIVIGGLAILVFYFTLFLFVAIVFHIRISLHPTPLSLSNSNPNNWTHDLRILYLTSALIFIRSIYRLIEYAGGNNGWLMRREWTLYVFDAALMWIVLVLFNFWPPGKKMGKGEVGVSDEEGYERRKSMRFRARRLEVLRSRSGSWSGNKERVVKGGVVESEIQMS